ncbi:NAD-dependent epimerase/dehydratase family protein [Hymenobacter terricola]|uniref:NAD-dependent epimerase/dehydratase family protein n=1 Tax=Hymenobacter terricola TaxID=2819236 RepID=UPI001B30A763|nr:NAD-dependent epimerase/dehydratase family protein [Hymenobacter terricola]
MKIKVIITGSTGMVGEGVLLECLRSPDVEQVLMLNRRPSPMRHPKLRELLVPDFLHLRDAADQLTGYDACFYCAGISSRGLNEAEYRRVTYDTTLHVAQTLAAFAPNMTFGYISGQLADTTSRQMWARVKGETENALFQLPFKHVYAMRPGMMRPTEGQQNVKTADRVPSMLFPLLRVVLPSQVITLQQIGQAMINSVRNSAPKHVLEMNDIKALAAA